MSLKVLLADDNITAQRMGTKILTEAGYQVIAVSNGAAAIKKIASDKPGLLILDVYMPGYTGLEVCEKVKNDPATAQMPVILTVTNMEPFNQQDGNRVRADGLMIKPFEATDLVAVVQKYEGKTAKAAAASAYQDTQKVATEEFKDASYEEWKTEVPEEIEPPKMEMSAEMAAAPALGFDEPAVESMSAVAEQPAANDFAAQAEAPAFSIEEHAAPSLDMSSLDLAPSLEPLPSLEVAASAAPPAELEFTSAPQVGDIAVTQAAELEVADTAGDVVLSQDPALVTNADEMSQFVTKMGAENAEEVVIGIAMPGLTAEEPLVEREADAVGAESSGSMDFPQPPPDLGYASTIKMDAYAEPESVAAAPAPDAPARRTTLEMDIQNALAGGSFAATAAAPAVAPEAPAAEAAPVEADPVHDELVAQFAAELDQAHEEREALGLNTPTAEEVALTEASMPPAPEVSASQLDEEKIAAAVNRALEKYKDGLRAELIATIVRELKG